MCQVIAYKRLKTVNNIIITSKSGHGWLREKVDNVKLEVDNVKLM